MYKRQQGGRATWLDAHGVEVGGQFSVAGVRRLWHRPAGRAGLGSVSYTHLEVYKRQVHGPAGVSWTTWEAATSFLHYKPDAVADFADPSFALAFARIENHFFVNGGWFREGQLIEDAHKVRHLPGVIVQGAYDLCCPPVTAWDLHRAWPEARFELVHAGHASFELSLIHI